MMTKFRNNKSNKNQGIHTIFGQHSVKAALQNDKREHIELILVKIRLILPRNMNLKYKKLPFFLKMNLQEDLEMRTQHME